MADITGRLRGVWSALRGSPYEGDSSVTTYARSPEYGRWADEQQRYDVLDAYYRNDDLYARLVGALKLSGYEGYQSIGNPANRLVELYAAKLPDRLLENLDTTRDSAEDATGGPGGRQPITPGAAATVPAGGNTGAPRGTPGPGAASEDNAQLKEAIKKLWEWSNWEDQSEVAARYFAIYGDLFIRVENSEDGERVQLNLLDPRDVTDWDKDARGHFEFLRLDIPVQERMGADEVEELTRTEIWDKVAETYQVWIHDKGAGAKIEDMPVTPETWVFSADPPDSDTQWTGYDFVPVVHRKLRDVGDPRGSGAFQHALDEIDALAEALTRLNAILFPKVIWKLTRAFGPGGVAYGPHQLEDAPGQDALTRLTRADQQHFAVVETSAGKMISLPSGVDMLAMVPPHDFGSHILALEKAENRLEKTIPELAYGRLREFGQVPAAKTVELLMMDMVDRLSKARAKFEDTHVRAHKMALTLAQLPYGVLRTQPIEGFANLGEYDSGALDHTFEEYDLFPISQAEQAEADVLEAEALAAILALPAEVARPMLERRGITPPATTLGDATLDAQREAIRARAATIAGGTTTQPAAEETTQTPTPRVR